MRNEAKLNEVKLNYTVWRGIKWNMIRQKQKRDGKGEGGERKSVKQKGINDRDEFSNAGVTENAQLVHSFIRFERERAALGTLLFAKLPHGSIACRFYPHIMMRIVLISFSCDTRIQGVGDAGAGRQWTRVNVSRRYGRSAKGRRNYERAAILRAADIRTRQIEIARATRQVGQRDWGRSIGFIAATPRSAQDEPCLQRRCENIHACRPFIV